MNPKSLLPPAHGWPPTGNAGQSFLLTLLNLSRVVLKVGIAGAITLYGCSFFATIAAALCSTQLFYHDGEYKFIAWCGTLFDRHRQWFYCYTSGLILSPLMPIALVRLLGPQDIADCPTEPHGTKIFRKYCPEHWLSRITAGFLFSPYIPTIVAASYVFVIIALLLGSLVIYALFQVGRYGGLWYLLTRLAVRDGVRDGVQYRRGCVRWDSGNGTP
jgi:hypothetical protein